MSNKSEVLTREQLYELVWSRPIGEIVAQYDMCSSVVVGICDIHRIPRPPSGYWSSKRNGHKPPQAALPACEEAKLQKITLRLRSNPDEERALDEEFSTLLRRARELPQIKVGSDLSALHPVVDATRCGLEKAQPGHAGLLSTRHTRGAKTLDVSVSRTSIARALGFLNALIEGIEQIGGLVTSSRKGSPEHPGIQFGGEAIIPMGLYEQTKTAGAAEPDRDAPWERPAMKYEGTGLLVFEAGADSGGPRCYDTPRRRRIEQSLNWLVIEFVMRAGNSRVYRIEAPERERREREAERQRQAKEQERMRREIQLAIRQRDEREKISRLVADAELWRQGQAIRAYADAVEATLNGAGTPDEAPERGWLIWARQQADRLDPLTPSPASVLDERPAT